MGKTALAKYLILRRYDLPGIIIDLESEFFKTHICENINYKRFYSVSSLIEYLNNNNAKWRYCNEKLILTEVEEAKTPEAEAKSLENLWVFIFYMKRKFVQQGEHFKMFIYLDESDSYFQKHSNSTLNYIIRKAGNLDIDIIAAFQRIQGIHNDLVSKFEKFYCFNTTLPADLEKIEELCSKSTVERVKHLRQFEYVCWNNKHKRNDEGYLTRRMLQYI